MPRHSETRTVPYRPEQLFDLVADVDRYPEFLPWCVGAKVRSRSETEMVADLTIGFGPFRESFTSRVALQRPDRIGVRYENGPFRYLTNQWRFEAVGTGCRVHFDVDFEFRSKLLQLAIGAVFQEAVRRMVRAFLARARAVHGAPPAAASGMMPGTPSEGRLGT
ncbi:MAG: type II toxin-antitoxin system RatA family toxin [Acetobacteraceae bacterium]|nr:type II toxin-antitoxin system RatA family toxin [Acetobacteraceae bacterium]